MDVAVLWCEKEPTDSDLLIPAVCVYRLHEAIQDSASDPRNGVMMKMLAMVKYGERAGSGLQGIFKTWQSVYHCAPKLEVTISSRQKSKNAFSNWNTATTR